MRVCLRVCVFVCSVEDNKRVYGLVMKDSGLTPGRGPHMRAQTQDGVAPDNVSDVHVETPISGLDEHHSPFPPYSTGTEREQTSLDGHSRPLLRPCHLFGRYIAAKDALFNVPDHKVGCFATSRVASNQKILFSSKKKVKEGISIEG